MKFTDLEIEQNILGSLLINNAAIMDIDLMPADFCSAEHGEIYRKYRERFGQSQRFDASDLHGTEGNYPDGMDAVTYARLLGENTISPTSSAIKDYAEIILELSRKRKIYDQIKQAEILLETSPSRDVISRLNGGLIENLDTNCLKTGADIHAEIIKALDLPREFSPTGLRPLDAAMAGGMYQGFTYGLCGAEKSGKTTMAHTISHNAAQAGVKHLYIALEMGALQIEQKNLARQVGINSLEFIRPSHDVKQKIRDSKATENVIYLDAPGATLDEILHQTGIAILKHGIKGFIVDYWQLVEGKSAKDTEERHMRVVAQSLANFARKKGVWCLLLAQMNKEGDLFGGGGLRKACDQLYFIETPERFEDFRYLRMGASRYTPRADVGSDESPAFVLNKKIGPYFTEAGR